MNLFGVGPAELIVVLIVALVFVGPERLPRLAADLARTIREIRKYTGALQAEFTEYVKEVEKETAGERNEWKQIEEGIGSATQSVTEALRSARSAATGDEPAPSAAAAQAPAAPAAGEPEWREIGAGLGEAPEPALPQSNGHPAETNGKGGMPMGNAAATNGAARTAAPPAEDRA